MDLNITRCPVTRPLMNRTDRSDKVLYESCESSMGRVTGPDQHGFVRVSFVRMKSGDQSSIIKQSKCNHLK